MKRHAGILSILCLYPLLAIAQSISPKGGIAGQVYDEATREPIYGANIMVLGTNLGAATDAEGRFSIAQVPIGTYSLRITAIGYNPFMKADIVVSVAKPAEVMLPLVESAVEVEAVQVNASFFQKIPDKPLSNLVQSNEEIRRLPGGLEDVVRAISILPGVAQVQPGRNDLIVRGGAPSENLYIVDNIELPNINHFGTQGASGGPLSFINLDFVESTSFSSGGFGVPYGDKLSSVLTIDLREGRKDRLGGKATISASQFGLNLEGPTGEAGNFIFSARRSYLDFIFKAAGFAFVPEYWDFLGKADYHLSPKDQLVVLGIGALDRVKYFNDTPDKRFDNSRVMGSDQNQFIGGVSWRHIHQNSLLTATIDQNYVDYFFKQNDSLLNPIFRNSSIEQETSLRADLLMHAARSTEIRIGASAKHIRFSSDIFLRPDTVSFGIPLGLRAIYGTHATKLAAYAQLSQEVARIRVTFGGRLDYFDLIEKPIALSPRLAATYAIDPTLNLNASLGRYYQAPSYVWLAANPANRKLAYVGCDQFILGVDKTVASDARVTIETYTKKYFDYPASLVRQYLVLANTGAGFGGSEEGFASFGLDPLASVGSGRARGLELLIQKKLSDIPWYGTASISYNTSDFVAFDGIERPSSFDQRWIINVGGGYVFNERWEFSAKFRYATGRPYTPYSADGTQLSSEYNGLRIDANHSLDVRIDRRWSLGTWTLVTYIDIQNIYNRKPVDAPRFNPRTQSIERSNAIGILPSIGISAEF
jgi:hypothetical protein